jgi:phosphoadenosine phosphosulfate reductase
MLGLAFSGGKDSLACWYLYKAKNPIVLWVNTGKAYPETLAIVDEIRAEAVEFIEINVDQQAQIDANGIPSDIVPIANTVHGMIVSGEKPVLIQSYLNCCMENITIPLIDAMKKRGITQIIKGQRNDESFKGESRHGTVMDGIEYIQPIEKWTSKQVLDFVATQRGQLPEHFSLNHTSLDCYDCTGFMKDSADRVEWTKVNHPELYDKYALNMSKLKGTIIPIVELMR